MKTKLMLAILLLSSISGMAQKKKTVPKSKAEPTAAELCDKAFDYLKGENGLPIDTTKAVYLFKQSADMGYSIAQCEYAKRCNNEDIAISYLQKAIDQNDSYAYYLMFLTYRNGSKKDIGTAMSYLRKGAELGDVTCQWLMGHAYYNGLDGIAQDGKMAEYWYGKAAEQNHDISMAMLAFMYDDGKLVKRDIQKAIELYRKAAELGNAEAAYNLAESYYLGDGVEVNKELAFSWCRKAAEKDHIGAQIQLGYFFATGYGCEKNEDAAGYWWRKVANNEKASEEDRKGARYNIGLLDEHIEIK